MAEVLDRLAEIVKAESDPEHIHVLLIANGWIPPLDADAPSLDAPIRKMESRQRHHSAIVRMEREYAEMCGDPTEAGSARADAERHARLRDEYGQAAILLRAIEEGRQR